jgi:hypothetical protein
MNDKEKILKYLSNLLSENEKEKFEKEISESTELRAEIEKIKNNLNKIKSLGNVDLDTSYFNNLLPKVRERIEQKSKKKAINPLLLMPTTAALIVVLFTFLFPADNSVNYQKFIKSLTQDSTGINFISYLEQTLPGSYGLSDSEDFDSSAVDSYLQLNASDIPSEELTSPVPLIEEYSYYSDALSESQIDQIYNKLKDKKIL